MLKENNADIKFSMWEKYFKNKGKRVMSVKIANKQLPKIHPSIKAMKNIAKIVRLNIFRNLGI